MSPHRLATRPAYLKTAGLLAKGLLLLVFSYLFILMVEICLRYFPWTDTTNFLVLKQDVVHTQPWRFAFMVHVATSSLVLLAGFTQFFAVIRRRLPRLHRLSGWLYVAVTFIFALPSGLVLAVYANGGVWTQVSFVLLGVLWGLATGLAVYYAIHRRWLSHRDWMIRSFALAASALSLRTWKLILYQLQPYLDWLTPMHIYQLESWLGWVVNLLVAELIIIWLRRGKMMV